ncbi:disintegrin and metalloproteinase domain-containing protein 20-like [Octodon degus]|uniref:Disintegrin and metalloproteinase domain-containing protein 20-like n=1 Tax=Octodon degus TaxID=10160 RepID=A0A6P6DBP3_OCTDE|nr:disintegrin and metalloproteinase domain-containing protein 20-like [Octodon degus]
MGASGAQNLLPGALCLSAIWAVLSPICCSQDPPRWRFTSSEVVIPRKVPHRMDGSKTPDQLSYSMRFRGRRHVIHMKLKKNLLPEHFPVLTNNDQGAMQEDYPFVPRDCYYYSYLEGVSGSAATLDTCSGGLRGMLQVDDFTYEIKPLKSSSKFEHIVSQLVSQAVSEDERCNIPEDEANQILKEVKLAESPRAAPAYLWRVHRKRAHLHYTVSNSLWLLQRNRTRVIENVVIMNNIIHSIYRPLGLNILIRVLCIWEDRDQVVLDNGEFTFPSVVMRRFGMWKLRNWYTSIPHSTSLLLTGHKMGSSIYSGNSDTICNPNWGVAFVCVSRYHLFLASTIGAHAIGHNLGLVHDTEGCVCFRRSACLMTPMPGLYDMASNCSFENVHKRLFNWDPCLSLHFPPYDNFPYVAPRCGDKITNNDEECDCGSLKECASNTCCGTNCIFTLGSVCDGESCCQDCKYAEPGTMCRNTLGICDLPEYCSGKNEICPNDFYIQDGTPCSPVAVCMRGNCSDRDLQCQALFGFQVKDAPPPCYEKLNIIGDRFGNCGLRELRPGTIPSKCEIDDVLCGILHCSRPEEVPGGGEHTTFHDIIVQGAKQIHCFGYDVHHGTELPEMGLVVDGATCGPGKFCHRQNCTFHQDMGFDCDVQTCNYRGVCNNLKHCHCIRGFKPPGCAEKGPGGSVDSGSPPDKEEAVQAKVLAIPNYVLVFLTVRFGLFMASILIGGLTKAKRAIDKRVYHDEYEVEP